MITITPKTTIGAIAEGSPTRTDFLDQLGIDTDRHADLTLGEACLNEDLSVPTVIDLLLRADTPESTQAPGDESQATIRQLTDYIVAKHHGYLRRELPWLKMLLDRVAPHETTHDLAQIKTVFAVLRSELEEHMLMEEQVLFPLIQEIDWASRRSPGCYSGGMERSLAQTEHDHRHFEDAMSQLQTLTQGFTPPESAGTAYRGFLKGLAKLAQDMDQHTHLEVEVLLPRVIATEARLRSKHAANAQQAPGR